ncbi:MAG: response regulator transcription factor [Cyclobacteriaceae bacterium]
MSAIRILVAEDHPAHAAKMEMLLSEAGYDLIAICDTSVETLRLFKATKPDLVILDIELSQGGNGIDIAEKIVELNPTPIIFATSFEDKATLSRALKTDPYAYLVKPVEGPSLQAAIELALYKFVNNRDKNLTSASQGAHDMSEDLIINDSFFIKSGSKLLKVPHMDLLWVEVSQDRYCDIVTEKRSYQIRTSMNGLEEKLDKSIFVRIHRSHIVNIHKVEGIDEIDMTVEVNEKSLPLGGTYKDNLINRFRLL